MGKLGYREVILTFLKSHDKYVWELQDLNPGSLVSMPQLLTTMRIASQKYTCFDIENKFMVTKRGKGRRDKLGV